VLLLGDIQQHEILAGDMRVLLAFGNDLQDAKESLVDITTRAISMYTTYYGGPPRTATASRTYLQVINVDTTFEGGGAAFTNSMSILLSTQPTTCDTISTYCWHHIIVHELGHLWNGYSLTVNEVDQWFREGFTDYLAFRLQHEMGLFNDAQWRSFLTWKEQEVQAVREETDIALEKAGEDLGANYELIYSGGFHFAHRLNDAIAARTNKQQDLIDVMRKLYSTHAGTGVLVDRVVLQVAAEQICTCDLKDLFREMLE
jgi:predicted metalloprotease with PDZ domain